MDLGLHIIEFEQHGKALNTQLKDIVQYADANGFYDISVMDHFFQIGIVGPPELNMLEAYTTLGYIAGVTERIKLLALVTGVIYRYPGILAKQVTTLDVLSGGRAILGIGAAWNEREAKGLGIPFPVVKDRFEMLEEALQVIHQMWSGEAKPYQGKHYQLAETINHPAPISKPHPPILIGGGGEKKTLRLVAKYGDACNLFFSMGTQALQEKLDVLKRHCDEVGRDFSEITLTAAGTVHPGEQASKEIVAQLKEVGKLGFTHAMLMLPNMHEISALEILVNEVMPEIAAM
ncbi:MAG: LLM class F420-dependent oxidoreductase [Anaerolineae bacterium]|nr:LLM class F420-dependent oxidoreductase [Anaerolineae bacterium]